MTAAFSVCGQVEYPWTRILPFTIQTAESTSWARMGGGAHGHGGGGGHHGGGGGHHHGGGHHQHHGGGHHGGHHHHGRGHHHGGGHRHHGGHHRPADSVYIVGTGVGPGYDDTVVYGPSYYYGASR